MVVNYSTSNMSIKDFNELNIFYSETGPLTDSWKAHDLNPIVVNPNIARNGGIIINNEKIFRVSQKMVSTYTVNIFR